MAIPVALGWILTAVFLFLLVPPFIRLTKLNHAPSSDLVRNEDLAEILLALAMVAMVSPVGGPIPAVGWEAVLGGTALWFAVAWVKSRQHKVFTVNRRRGYRDHLTEHHHGHHAISALAMVYMLAAMGHHHGGTNPWFTMSGTSTVDSIATDSSTVGEKPGLFLPLVLVLMGYFMIDAARSGMIVVRSGAGESKDPVARFWCRGVMGLGMSYMFAAAL